MVFVVKLWLQATTGNKNAQKTRLAFYYGNTIVNFHKGLCIIIK